VWRGKGGQREGVPCVWVNSVERWWGGNKRRNETWPFSVALRAKKSVTGNWGYPRKEKRVEKKGVPANTRSWKIKLREEV